MENKPSVYFFSEGIKYVIPKKKTIRDWIFSSIISENKSPGTINIIFCDDQYLHKINLDYLKHDYLTDIITFNNNDGDIISADIFISIDRAEENARKYKVKKISEIHRLIIHGILHLLGYDDKTPGEKQLMSEREDYYLSLLPIHSP